MTNFTKNEPCYTQIFYERKKHAESDDKCYIYLAFIFITIIDHMVLQVNNNQKKMQTITFTACKSIYQQSSEQKVVYIICRHNH